MAPRSFAQTASGLDDFRAGRFAEAMQAWQNAAAAGEASGALYAGVLFDTGLGVPEDAASALQWYRRASDLGSGPAAFNIGVFYDAGIGVAKDPAEAARWYQLAADRGFARAEFNLALLDDAQGDRRQALQHYRRAAQHGITAARSHLPAPEQTLPAVRHAVGDPAMDDFQRAQRVLLARGPGDAAQAASLLRRAAERNNPLAEYDLGYCYEHGIGVRADPVQAYGWYGRAAQHATDQTVHEIALTGLRSAQQQMTEAQLQQAAPRRHSDGANP